MTADVTGAARDEGEQVAGTAHAEAGAVGGAAAAAAQDVAETVAEQAGAVAGESIRSVRDLLGDLRGELGLQASTQTMRAGELAYTLADDLDSMAEGSAQQGVASDVARTVAERARKVGEFLQSRDPDQLLEEVRLLARRRPGAFLLGAAAAGVVAGRLGRGAAAARSGSAGRSGGDAARVTPRAAPVTVSPGLAVATEPVEVGLEDDTLREGPVLGREVPEAPVTAAGRSVTPPLGGSAALGDSAALGGATTDRPGAPTRDLSGTARRAAADARRTADARRSRR